MTVSFVNLLHTEFSPGRWAGTGQTIDQAGAGMPAVVVTDMSTMPVGEVSICAMGGGIKPICGADIWLASADEGGPLSRLTLLVMNAKGYRNLTELVSRGWSDGQSNDFGDHSRQWARCQLAWIALSGAKEGEVGHALLNRTCCCRSPLREWMTVFPLLSTWRTAPTGLMMI
jgi:DNA polymerase-3 subunit alpha